MARACSYLSTGVSSFKSSADRRARKRSKGSSDRRAFSSSLAAACFNLRLLIKSRGAIMRDSFASSVLTPI